MDIEPCMFCLEVIKNDEEVITLILNQYERGTCNCRIYTHVSCWMSYILHKGYAECPLCHTVIRVAQPTIPIIENPSQEIHVIHNNQVYQYRIPSTSTTHQLVIPSSTSNSSTRSSSSSNSTSSNDTIVMATCNKSKKIGCLLSFTLILMIIFYFIRR